MSVSNKVAHLSNKEHSSIAKVSLCPFVPADVSEVMINYKSKRKEVSDAGKQSKQLKTESNLQEHEASIQTITNLSSPSSTGSAQKVLPSYFNATADFYADRCIARFFYEKDIPFHAAR